nr:MAG TPA: hypothetical protein [Caudoviricetes sp.]
MLSCYYHMLLRVKCQLQNIEFTTLPRCLNGVGIFLFVPG